MKKPLLSEMTLREKIGQMLAPMHWDVYGKDEKAYDYSQSNIDEVKALYEKEQFGVIRGEQVGVFYADPENNGKVEKVEGDIEGFIMANFSIKCKYVFASNFPLYINAVAPLPKVAKKGLQIHFCQPGAAVAHTISPL